MTGHPDLPRFKMQICRAAKYADEHAYWQGSLASFRLVAVDLGYSHEEIDSWIAEGFRKQAT
jgi:hypothetical protein